MKKSITGMNNHPLVRTVLLMVIAVMLGTLIYILFVGGTGQKKNTKAYNVQAWEKTRAWSKTHPHLENLQLHLFGADHWLRKSINYGSFPDEKKSVLVEINFVQNFIESITNESVYASSPIEPSGDEAYINNVLGNLRIAANEVSVAEEDALTSQEKNSLHAHLQTALDKMLEVQQAEQKSQPEKSNP